MITYSFNNLTNDQVSTIHQLVLFKMKELSETESLNETQFFEKQLELLKNAAESLGGSLTLNDIIG